MKFLPALFVTLALLVAGCVGTGGTSPATRSPNNPPGTAQGGSYPGVNQPTTTTQTGRANSTTDDVPNSVR